MKKLKKLTINPEKLMNNEELINLRGGYEGMEGLICCQCKFATGYYVGGFTFVDEYDCATMDLCSFIDEQAESQWIC